MALQLSSRMCLKICRRKLNRKMPLPGDQALVPDLPESSKVEDIGEVPSFDHKLITHLERLSLIRFSNEEAVANLRESIKLANRLKHVKIEGVEPMYTVWEDMKCPLREDNEPVELGRSEILTNAKKTLEDYFITPPGNIPLNAASSLDLKLIHEWDKLGQPNPPDPRTKTDA